MKHRTPHISRWAQRFAMPLALGVTFLTALGVATAEAGTSGRVYAAGGAFRIPVKSRKEIQWQSVVAQQYDYSCGSAAVATLLTFHYERPTSEEEVLRAMFARGNQDKIRSDGFSLLDMKLFLDGLGYKTDGFRMTLDKLERIAAPAIALINTNGYSHFVVIKGIENDRVVVGDSALGTTVYKREDFEAMWNGVILGAREFIQVAKRYFNDESDWAVLPRAPIGRGFARRDTLFTLTLPGAGELRFN